MSEHTVRARINGAEVECDVDSRTPLADMLRNKLGLSGTKISCEAQICGSCTVLVDGLPVSSCVYLGVDVDGRVVTTIEGVSSDESPSIVQQAFVDAGAIQCGYCTPGFVLAVTALLNECEDPSEEEAMHFLDGNICRCTGYARILQAVHSAAQARREVMP
jgi:aerobic carbon-monoxide dehydrogenase small subunit